MPSSDAETRADLALKGLAANPPPAPPAPGERHEILGMLGEGAASIVYRAVDRKLCRDVALKVLREALAADAQSAARFRQEAQVMAQLSHPNVVAVHDVVDVGGAPALVMELVDGRPLGAILRDGGLRRSELVAILEKAARGVGAAHARGIVHRDLKPANILVTHDGEPKVGDFGLARVAGGDGAVTRTGAVLGTPLYMAPEQVRGDLARISPRTDVYALGAILYEILAGRTPHASESVSDIYARILGDDPVPPGRRVPGTPLDLETIALKALEKEPSRRYEDAVQFADELRRFLDEKPILARPVTTAERMWRRVVRNRHALLPVAAALAFAVLAGAWALEASRKGREEVEAVRRRRQAEAEALTLVERARPGLERAARAFYEKDFDYDEVMKPVLESRALLVEAIRLSPDLAMARYVLAQAEELRGLDDLAEKEYRRAVELDPKLGPARFRLGRLLVVRAFLRTLTIADNLRVTANEEAAVIAAEAKREIEAATAQGSGFDDEIQRQVAEATLAYTRGDFERVHEIASAGIAKFGTRTGTEELHWLTGVVRGDMAGRLEAYDQALAIRPHFPIARFCRGLTGSTIDTPREARDYGEVIRVNPNFVEAYSNRAMCRRFLGDYEGAKADCTEAVLRRPGYAVGYLVRGFVCLDLADDAGAEADFTKALELEPRIAEAWSSRAGCRQRRGDGEGALADAEAALKISSREIKALYVRAAVRAHRGERKAARADFDEVLRLLPADSPMRARVRQERDALGVEEH